MCAFVSLCLPAQELRQRYANYGETIVAYLSTAPFPHPKRAEGHKYNNQVFPPDKHYSDSTVVIFIPMGYKQTEKVDFIVHFHGWWNNVDTVLERYRLIEQFYESGKNAILVVPEGPRNAPDSFGGKLEDPGGFKRFMDDIVNLLFSQKKIKTKNIGNIVLSGHSGGFHAISFILMRGGLASHIREVYLFDALYGQTEKYVYWLDHYKGKIIDIYTDSGGTKGETESLMADLDGWGVPYFAVDEKDATLKDLQKNRLIFLHTDLEHDAVMHVHPNFREHLKASVLSQRVKH
jgi:hypothetical protein